MCAKFPEGVNLGLVCFKGKHLVRVRIRGLKIDSHAYSIVCHIFTVGTHRVNLKKRLDCTTVA